MVTDVNDPILDHAEAAFAFLISLGFERDSRANVGVPGMSMSGWELTYRSPTVWLRLLYADYQLEINFERSGARLEYFTLDRDAYDRRSGYHGNMFPSDKLAPVIDRVAADIQANYTSLLAGEQVAWDRAIHIQNAPKTKRRLP